MYFLFKNDNNQQIIIILNEYNKNFNFMLGINQLK